MEIILNDSTDAIKQRLLNPRNGQIAPGANNSNVNPNANVRPDGNVPNLDDENVDTFNLTNKDDESCTDGKDDGSIGFVDAAGNVLKGIGNGVINTAKACVTDEQGDFSLTRTLVTAGSIAVCVMFPPLGVLACGAGALIGANQLGNGLYNAFSSDTKTDAQAKKAWQDVGEGLFTEVASLAGGRGALGAMKNTSTAVNAGSALKNLSTNASVKDKAAALVSDATSSIKNNFVKIKDLKTDIKNRENLIKKYGYDSTLSGFKTIAGTQAALK